MLDTQLIPLWIKSELFEDILRKNIPGFKEIQKFKITPALPPGENYISTLLKVWLDVKLADHSLACHNLMLKVPNRFHYLPDQWHAWDVFAIETQMYFRIIPEFEDLYQNVGLNVRFAPKAFTLPVKEKHLLMEDLTARGFVTLKRQNLLDMEHCRFVLKKMAQWHAVSAVRVERTGAYDAILTEGIMNIQIKDIIGSMFNDCLKFSLPTIKKLKHSEEYYEKLQSFCDCLTDKLREHCRRDFNEFKVLNHGDFWSNNVMFQYNEMGQLQDAKLIDFQMHRYGSPAQDLYYFLLSSSQLDFKIARFDEMVQYYHENLTHYLDVLKYKKKMPTLRHIHSSLIHHGLWGVLVSISLMGVIVFDHASYPNIDTVATGIEADEQLMKVIFSDDRYVQHLEVVLPWLNARGAFDK